MKYLKSYENITDSDWNKYINQTETLSIHEKAELIEDIENYVESISFIDDDEMSDCPFFTELALIYQREYIEEMYNQSPDLSKYEESDYINAYSELLKKANKYIVRMVTEDPTLYKWCIGFDTIKIPDYIKKMNKYNL